MRKTGPDLLQAVGTATIRCRGALPGPELDVALEQLRAAIREYAPTAEANRDYGSRGAVHEIADRWLGGVAVARLLAWEGEPTE